MILVAVAVVESCPVQVGWVGLRCSCTAYHLAARNGVLSCWALGFK